MEWTPQGLAKCFKCNFKCKIASYGMYLTFPTKSDIWMLHCSAFQDMTIVTCHFCFQVRWVCAAFNFGSNLGYVLAINEVGKVLYLCMLEFLAVKQVGKVFIYTCYVSKALQPRNVEILILCVLSNDDCKFAINLFPISWGPFENNNLLYFLLKMQIWNGFNVFNIPGNLIKDINVNLSFLSVCWKVVE